MMKRHRINILEVKTRAKLSTDMLATIGNNETLPLMIIEKIAKVLSCQPKDVVKMPDSPIPFKTTIFDKATAVIMCDLRGNEIRRFDSINEAARFLGKPPGAISRCLNGKGKKAYGYRWKRAE